MLTLTFHILPYLHIRRECTLIHLILGLTNILILMRHKVGEVILHLQLRLGLGLIKFLQVICIFMKN